MYSATSILTESNLHTRVLQTKLSPKLGPLIPIIREELDYAMTQELPVLDSMYLQHSFLHKTRTDNPPRRLEGCRGLRLDNSSYQPGLFQTLCW